MRQTLFVSVRAIHMQFTVSLQKKDIVFYKRALSLNLSERADKKIKQTKIRRI